MALVTTSPVGARDSSCLTRSSSEQGSAFLLTLFVLVILTIIGISLLVVSETEALMGSQERTIERSFFAADAGFSVATGKVLHQIDYRSNFFLFRTTRESTSGSASMLFKEQVSTPRVLPIAKQPCDWCEINGGSEFALMTNSVTSRSLRRAFAPGVTSDADSVPLSQSTVSGFLLLEPWHTASAPSPALEHEARAHKQ